MSTKVHTAKDMKLTVTDDDGRTFEISRDRVVELKKKSARRPRSQMALAAILAASPLAGPEFSLPSTWRPARKKARGVTEDDRRRLAKAEAKRERRRERNRKLAKTQAPEEMAFPAGAGPSKHQDIQSALEDFAATAEEYTTFRCPKCSIWQVPGMPHFCPVEEQELEDLGNDPEILALASQVDSETPEDREAWVAKIAADWAACAEAEPPTLQRAPSLQIPQDLAPTWQSTREQWNRDNECARKACRADITHRRWWNSGSRLFYCTSCANRINQYAVEPLCVEMERA